MRAAFVRSIIPAFALCAAAAACSGSSTEPVACTREARPAISIVLEDSVTGARSPFVNVRAAVTDAPYSDAATIAQITDANQPVSLAFERAGTYSVAVQANGYQPWFASGVVVSRNTCHVVTVTLTARLKRVL